MNYLIEPACMHEDLVFHFTNADAGLNIIKSLEFRAGRLVKTNDIRENLLYQQFQFTNLQLKEMLEKQCHTFSFSSNFQRLESNIRFSGYKKPRMWAQYANNSSGLCLIIDKNLFLKCINDSHDCQYCFDNYIEYQEILPDFTTQAINIHEIEKYQHDLFFTKHLDWRDENEYRVLVITEKEEFSIKIPCDSHCFIKGVIMGPKFQYIAELIYRLRKYGLINYITLYNSSAKYDGITAIYFDEKNID